jgi:hypothetical protein
VPFFSELVGVFFVGSNGRMQLLGVGVVTLIARVHTEEGIVLAADSRSTFVYEDGRSSDWQDVTQKVFQVGCNVGIAFSGFTHSDVPRIHIPTTLQEFARQYDPMRTYDPANIRSQLADTLDRQVGLKRLSRQEHEAMFLVTGYGAEAQGAARKSILFSSHENYFVWHNEQPDVLLMGDADGYDAFEEYRYSVRPDLRTVDQAVAFVNSAYLVVASRTNLVGGAVDVLVLRPDRATWRQRKLLNR